MRSQTCGWVFAVVLLAASAAQAQFANRRIGFELGALSFRDDELRVGLMAQLEGTYYIENGFEVGLRVPFFLFLTTSATTQRFGTGGQLYVRYLISEEALRPWVGLEVDVLAVFRPGDPANPNEQQNVFFGPGLSAGLEYFVADTVSIGIRPFFTLYIALNNNAPIRPGYGGAGSVHFYF
jgi:outer membrane protein